METEAVVIGLVLAMCLLHSKSVIAFAVGIHGVNQMTNLTGAWGGTVASTVNCKLLISTSLPAFSMDGDFIIGGVFSLHSYMHTINNNYSAIPEPVRCRGRSVRGRSGS